MIACDDEQKGRIDKAKIFNNFELLGNYDNGEENYQLNNYIAAGSIRLEKTKRSNDCINNTNTRRSNQQLAVRNINLHTYSNNT